jgi:ubiquinone/menaquinone biosynthesis C-methylase UbiE
LKPSILRTNATPVYAFLSLIQSCLEVGESLEGRRILDCGAGGRVPPVALFAEQGMAASGLDIDEESLAKAREYVIERGLSIELAHGDMRSIPFDDASFDYVFEHYSMCHLSKADTQRAIDEMRRVLKPGGLAFLGVIAIDSWPKAWFGTEASPGEFWGDEGGERTRHTMFADSEADALVAGWEIVSKEKRVRYLREAAESLSAKEWAELRGEDDAAPTEAEWRTEYSQRTNACRYVHLYYYLRKLGE